MLRYQPKKLTTAQALLVTMGLDDLRLDAHYHPREKHPTKRGPGRVHEQGLEKDKRIKARPPMGFVVHTNAARAERRAKVKDYGGIRRFKRLTQLHRPAELPF
jgi:hypothetical protein